MAKMIPAIIIQGSLFTLQDGPSIKLAEECILPQLNRMPIKQAVKVARLIVKTAANVEDVKINPKIIKFANCRYGNNVANYIQKRQMLCKTAEDKEIYAQILDKKNFVSPEDFVYLVQEMDKKASINPDAYSYLSYERFITIDPVEVLWEPLNG